MTLSAYLTQTARNLEAAATAGLDDAVDQAAEAIVEALKAHRPLLVCGNGGSMADSMHLAGELVARFKKERSGLPAIALGTNLSAATAWANDYDYVSQFAREVEALGVEGGVLFGISTSGNSANVVRAMEAAKAKGMTAIALTGDGGGVMGGVADILIASPMSETARVQETHLPIYHYLCQKVEDAFA